MRANRKQRGFTLIELMIVVAIVGIVAAFAYPSYMDQIRKSRRADALIGLQGVTQRQEDYFTRNYSYANSLSALGYGAGTTTDSPEDYYSLQLATLTPSACDGTRIAPCTGYEVSATPVAGTSQAGDKKCQRFILNHLGRKAANDDSATVTDTTSICW